MLFSPDLTDVTKDFHINTEPNAKSGGRIKLSVDTVRIFASKFLIKAIGDAARHPLFIRSSNRVLILGRN